MGFHPILDYIIEIGVSEERKLECTGCIRDLGFVPTLLETVGTSPGIADHKPSRGVVTCFPRDAFDNPKRWAWLAGWYTKILVDLIPGESCAGSQLVIVCLGS
jgi:hypothetical protein